MNEEIEINEEIEKYNNAIVLFNQTKENLIEVMKKLTSLYEEFDKAEDSYNKIKDLDPLEDQEEIDEELFDHGFHDRDHMERWIKKNKKKYDILYYIDTHIQELEEIQSNELVDIAKQLKKEGE